MYTINALAKQFSVSRSTLLHYDKIGLLVPSARNDANYRLYSVNDVKRMQKIVTYREAGLSLDAIKEVLNAGLSDTADILEKRLISVNKEISKLRDQQKRLLSLLDNQSSIRLSKTMSKEQWVSILRASGMDDKAMHQWHIEFERELPEMHQDFLESLGCSEKEVEQIRNWSRS